MPRLQNNMNARRYTTKAYLLMLYILFSTIVLTIIMLIVFTNHRLLIVRSETINIGLVILPCAYFVVISLLLFLIYRRIIRPLKDMETMLYSAYFDIIHQAGSRPEMKSIQLNEILEFVITNQQESLNRELIANFLLKKAELAELQSRINPHFLFNTLESIRGLAVMEGAPDVANMVESLSSMFRNSIRNIDELVPLADEIENIENYITIQQFRFRNKFTYQKRILVNQDMLRKCCIPNFILQPIIENAIYHGLESKISGGEIVLHAYPTQSRLIIRIIDNGTGINSRDLYALNKKINEDDSMISNDNTETVHTGIGLSNINKRIKLQFGHEYGVSISSTLNIGTQIEVRMPLTFSASSTAENELQSYRDDNTETST